MVMKRRRVVFTLIACIISLVTITSPVNSEPQALDRDLKVMTYNIAYGWAPGNPPIIDLEKTARTIKNENPDIVGVQEILRGCGNRYNYMDQVAMLAELLEMNVYFAPVQADYEEEPGKPHCQIGNAIFSNYPILESKSIILPWSLIYQRGLLDVLVNVKGVPVRVYNTHLQNNPKSPQAKQDRTDQVQAILEYAGEFEEPTVLMGDLNAEPHWSEIAPLYEHLTDAWLMGGDGGPGFTLNDRRIDYVFVSPDIEVNHTIVPQTGVSDHRPVVTSLSLPGFEVGIGNNKNK